MGYLRLTYNIQGTTSCDEVQVDLVAALSVAHKVSSCINLATSTGLNKP